MTDGHVPNPGHYAVFWSEEDQEYVGTHSGFPSMSWLYPLPEEALRGIRNAIRDARVDVVMETVDPEKPAVTCTVHVQPEECCTAAFEAGAAEYEQHKREQPTGLCPTCATPVSHGTYHWPSVWPDAEGGKPFNFECRYCGEDYTYCKHDPVWAEEQVDRMNARLRRLEKTWGT